MTKLEIIANQALEAPLMEIMPQNEGNFIALTNLGNLYLFKSRKGDTYAHSPITSKRSILKRASCGNTISPESIESK